MGARAPSWAPPTPTHPQVPGVPFTEPLSSTPPPQAGEALNQISGFRPTSCPHPQMQGVSPNHILALIAVAGHPLRVKVTPRRGLPQ